MKIGQGVRGASGRSRIEAGVRDVMERDASLLRAVRADDSETPSCATQEPTGYAQADEWMRAEGRAEEELSEHSDGRRIGSGCDVRAQGAVIGVGTQEHARTLEDDRDWAAGCSTGDRGCRGGNPGALAACPDSTGEDPTSPFSTHRGPSGMAWCMGRGGRCARPQTPSQASGRACSISNGANIRCGSRRARQGTRARVARSGHETRARG